MSKKKQGNVIVKGEKMDFEYEILNPGGNKTALVIGNEYENEIRREINNQILKENLEVEQVGFISLKDKKLEMAGAEFCVNATRCAIWKFLNGEENDVEVSVSGYNEKIRGGILKDKTVYVNMEINKDLNDLFYKEGDFYFVKLDGILLLVLSEENAKDYIKELKQDAQKTKLRLKEIIKFFGVQEKAIGIILPENDEGKIKIHPVIWVKEIDSTYYESACGSGSLAMAIYLNSIFNEIEFEILQPSGFSINISLNLVDDVLKSAMVSGKVIQEGSDL